MDIAFLVVIVVTTSVFKNSSFLLMHRLESHHAFGIEDVVSLLDRAITVGPLHTSNGRRGLGQGITCTSLISVSTKKRYTVLPRPTIIKTSLQIVPALLNPALELVDLARTIHLILYDVFGKGNSLRRRADISFGQAHAYIVSIFGTVPVQQYSAVPSRNDLRSFLIQAPLSKVRRQLGSFRW
jgi:hypothetical protein